MGELADDSKKHGNSYRYCPCCLVSLLLPLLVLMLVLFTAVNAIVAAIAVVVVIAAAATVRYFCCCYCDCFRYSSSTAEVDLVGAVITSDAEYESKVSINTVYEPEDQVESPGAFIYAPATNDTQQRTCPDIINRLGLKCLSYLHHEFIDLTENNN